MLHRHLIRQLRKLGLSDETPPTVEQWSKLLAGISRTYDDSDRERYTLERSISLSSREMQDLNNRLRAEREELAQIFGSAPSGMVRVNLQGTVTQVNASFSAVLGAPAAQLASRPFWHFLLPEDENAIRGTIEALAAGQRDSWRGECRFKGPDTALIFANVGIALVRDGSARPQFMIAMVEDVTEQTRLEIELRHSQKLESVGRLAAGIAHEINTPIQFVGDNVNFVSSAMSDLLTLCSRYRVLCDKASAAALAAGDLAEMEAAEQTADLDYIRENVPAAIKATLDGVRRVAHIVQSMKAFAHPDKDERSMADINAALRSTLTVAGNELKYVAQVETDLGELPQVACFLSDLNQVFLNLLVNAAHAIADVVGNSGKKGLIRVRSRLEGTQVIVSISDSGTGIPEPIRARIFDPFFTTKEVGKGTGQGLALAHAVVVEEHGGTLTFDTTMGVGTTFHVRLPLFGQPTAAESHAA